MKHSYRESSSRGLCASKDDDSAFIQQSLKASLFGWDTFVSKGLDDNRLLFLSRGTVGSKRPRDVLLHIFLQPQKTGDTWQYQSDDGDRHLPKELDGFGEESRKVEEHRNTEESISDGEIKGGRAKVVEMGSVKPVRNNVGCHGSESFVEVDRGGVFESLIETLAESGDSLVNHRFQSDDSALRKVRVHVAASGSMEVVIERSGYR